MLKSKILLHRGKNQLVVILGVVIIKLVSQIFRYRFSIIIPNKYKFCDGNKVYLKKLRIGNQFYYEPNPKGIHYLVLFFPISTNVACLKYFLLG